MRTMFGLALIGLIGGVSAGGARAVAAAPR